jgi:hypothetical protein
VTGLYARIACAQAVKKSQDARSKKNPDLTRFLITQGPGFFAATKRVAYKQPFTEA